MFKKIKQRYNWGGRFLTNQYHQETKLKNEEEVQKQPYRFKVLNFLLSTFDRETKYLEIGVRNPADNFNRICASQKYSVDPGVEYLENPVDFALTSDDFFNRLRKGDILHSEIKFDVIFIDGLHLAEQVDRDIQNALDFIREDGFIVLHDCNPPTEWHAREDYYYDLTPAMRYWNGTTWKAFYKYRCDNTLTSTCIDTDWGIGVLTKRKLFNSLDRNENPFFEFNRLDIYRKEHLNLISFEEFKLSILNDKKLNN